jgi:hypothetical protein
MSERSHNNNNSNNSSHNTPSYPQEKRARYGWNPLPCTEPLPAWPKQRYFLHHDRLGGNDEFCLTMYEDYVDAYCIEHAVALAEDRYGGNWGAFGRIEWTRVDGTLRSAEFPLDVKVLPNGVRIVSPLPQREATFEWQELVVEVEETDEADEAAVFRFTKRELTDARECLKPKAEPLEELNDLALWMENWRERRAAELQPEQSAQAAQSAQSAA